VFFYLLLNSNLYVGVDPSSGPLSHGDLYPSYFLDGYKSLMPCSEHDGKGLIHDSGDTHGSTPCISSLCSSGQGS
jgi:hypothetical protein